MSENNINQIMLQSSSYNCILTGGEASTHTYVINAIINYANSLNPNAINKKKYPCHITTNSVSIPHNKS